MGIFPANEFRTTGPGLDFAVVEHRVGQHVLEQMKYNLRLHIPKMYHMTINCCDKV